MLYLKRAENMYIKRAIEETVRKIAATFPVLLVIGPRQVGKSTLLSICPNRIARQ